MLSRRAGCNISKRDAPTKLLAAAQESLEVFARPLIETELNEILLLRFFRFRQRFGCTRRKLCSIEASSRRAHRYQQPPAASHVRLRAHRPTCQPQRRPRLAGPQSCPLSAWRRQHRSSCAKARDWAHLHKVELLLVQPQQLRRKELEVGTVRVVKSKVKEVPGRRTHKAALGPRGPLDPGPRCLICIASR